MATVAPLTRTPSALHLDIVTTKARLASLYARIRDDFDHSDWDLLPDLEARLEALQSEAADRLMAMTGCDLDTWKDMVE